MDYKIKASTILEAVVASIIFMIVFFMSISFIVTVRASENDNKTLVVITDFKTCIHEFKEGGYATGEYIKNYEWGEITIKVKKYLDISEIQEVYFETNQPSSRNKIIHRILISSHK